MAANRAIVTAFAASGGARRIAGCKPDDRQRLHLGVPIRGGLWLGARGYGAEGDARSATFTSIRRVTPAQPWRTSAAPCQIVA